MMPPMYFTLRAALEGTSSDGVNNPRDVRDFILKRSEYSNEYRELWRKFIKDNESDETAKFIAVMLDSPM